MGTRSHLASEQQSLQIAIDRLPAAQKQVRTVIARLRRHYDLPRSPYVLDVGAGVGVIAAAFCAEGCRVSGVEPFAGALETAERLANHIGAPFDIVHGFAESIPFPDNTFEFVHAASVIEHVDDVDKALAEIYRVLAPGGVFWFSAASGACPKQSEIRGFPFFGWYPLSTKRRIMAWAKENKPHLIGHTTTPAINWLTPGNARRKLEQQGFTRVLDRWTLRGEDEGGAIYRAALGCVRMNSVSRAVADMFVEMIGFAAMKQATSEEAS